MLRLLLAVLFVIGAGCAQAQSPSNAYGIAIASAARTSAQVNSSDIINTSYSGVHVLTEVSAFTSGTCTPKIQAKNALTGTYYDLLVGVAMAATGIQVLKIYPGIAVAANGAAADFIPLTWRVQVNCAGGPAMTYSVAFFSER